MNIEHTVNGFPLILSILTLLAGIVVIAWLLIELTSSKNYNETSVPWPIIVMVAFITVLLTNIAFGVKSHRQYIPISELEVMKTERFIQVVDETGELLYETRDYYTIANFDNYKFIEKTWDTNLWNYTAWTPKFNPVKNSQVEAEKVPETVEK